MHPFIRLSENITSRSEKIQSSYNSSLISTEDALNHGEDDHLFKIVRNPNDLNKSQDDDDMQIIGLKLMDIQYDNSPCSLIVLKNWTNYIRYQLNKQTKEMQDMMTATVSHEMRAPIFFILTMIENIMAVTTTSEQVRMLKIINNSAMLLLYLVNDMLDIYMLKSGKFQKILDHFNLQESVIHIYDMFYLQAQAKGIELILVFEEGVPEKLVSDNRRL